MEEPTSVRIERLLEICKKDDMSRYKTALRVAGAMANRNDRVNIHYMDLVGLIINVARGFEDK